MRVMRIKEIKKNILIINIIVYYMKLIIDRMWSY